MSTYERLGMSPGESERLESHGQWDTSRDGDPCMRCGVPREMGARLRCLAPVRATYDASTDPVPRLVPRPTGDTLVDEAVRRVVSNAEAILYGSLYGASEPTVCGKCMRPPAEHKSGPRGFICPTAQDRHRGDWVAPINEAQACFNAGMQSAQAFSDWAHRLEASGCCHHRPGGREKHRRHFPAEAAIYGPPTPEAREAFKAAVTVRLTRMQAFNAKWQGVIQDTMEGAGTIAATPSTMLGEALAHIQRARDLLRQSLPADSLDTLEDMHLSYAHDRITQRKHEADAREPKP